jgi:predicted nucleic acid-binding Zn ribbon protein
MNKPRFNKSKTISEVLKEMRKTYRLDSKLTEVALQEKWPSIVGELIARHTAKLKLFDGKLYIYVDNAPLRNELAMRKDAIRDLVNGEAGEIAIREVHIR